MNPVREQELLSKLEVELPMLRIVIDERSMIASWHDFNAVTFGDSEEEQRVINRWLLKKIGEMVGYQIRKVRESDGNGHCNLWFARRAS